MLRLRIVAPEEFRISMAKEPLHLSREDAISHIAKIGQDRRRWTQFLYGTDCGDPALYDLVVNL